MPAEDAQVVVTCAQNNDGNLGPRTAWTRGTVGFELVEPFDFEELDGSGGVRREAAVREEHLREVFESG